MAHDQNGKWIGYGEGDRGPEVTKIERRLALAYPRNSHANELGVVVDDYFDTPTKQSLIELTQFMNADQRERERLLRLKVKLPMRTDGIADLNVRTAIGAYVAPPPVAPRQKWPCQGVWADSRAFLSPPDAHSFEKATNDFANEGVRLYETMVGRKIWAFGYSMGGVSVQKFLSRLRPEWRENIEGVITFGDPSMPADGSLNGDTSGEGISRLPQPEWVHDRYWSYAIEGDWYPQARGLLFLFYKVLTKAEMTMDFALYLFTQFPTAAFQELLGQKASTDPVSQSLNGVLAPLAGMMTSGPLNVVGSLLGPASIFAVLPNMVYLLFDAIRFMATNAHGQYGNPAFALWDGMTAVDHAAQMVRDHSPRGATCFLFPGTWSNWDQLFQFDTWVRLSGDTL